MCIYTNGEVKPEEMSSKGWGWGGGCQLHTRHAALSELDRFPLHFDIIKSRISYWHRLENLGQSFPLLQSSFLVKSSINFLVTNIDGIRNLN